MRTKVAMVMLLIVLGGVAAAQTPVTSSQKLAWDHTGADVEKFQVCVDGGAPANCTDIPGGASVREVPIPAMTPGNHTLTINTCNVAGCALTEPALPVRLVVVPQPATNLRIVPGGN